jgi:hypothetical protein
VQARKIRGLWVGQWVLQEAPDLKCRRRPPSPPVHCAGVRATERRFAPDQQLERRRNDGLRYIPSVGSYGRCDSRRREQIAGRGLDICVHNRAGMLVAWSIRSLFPSGPQRHLANAALGLRLIGRQVASGKMPSYSGRKLLHGPWCMSAGAA